MNSSDLYRSYRPATTAQQPPFGYFLLLRLGLGNLGMI